MAEIEVFQAPVAHLCGQQWGQVLASTQAMVRMVGTERINTARWSESTLAAISEAGITITDITPVFDQQPMAAPVKGK